MLQFVSISLRFFCYDICINLSQLMRFYSMFYFIIEHQSTCLSCLMLFINSHFFFIMWSFFEMIRDGWNVWRGLLSIYFFQYCSRINCSRLHLFCVAQRVHVSIWKQFSYFIYTGSCAVHLKSEIKFWMKIRNRASKNIFDFVSIRVILKSLKLAIHRATQIFQQRAKLLKKRCQTVEGSVEKR